MKIEVVLATKGASVVTIGRDDPLTKALQVLAEHNIGALVVVDESGAPRGILSERNVVRALAEGVDVAGRKARDLMTSPVIVGSPQDDVDSVLRTMTEGHFRHMPIVDGGELCGIVTIGDLVKVELTQYQGTVDTLQTQLMDQE